MLTTQRHWHLIIVITTFASVSCSDPAPTAPPSTAAAARYPFEVVWESHPFDGHGASTLGPLQGTAGPLRCGPTGSEAEFTWTFVEHVDRFDVYTVTRRFALDAPDPEEVTTRVEYIGSSMVIFEDDVQRVIMRPVTKQPPY